jgi:hypothetical protein
MICVILASTTVSVTVTDPEFSPTPELPSVFLCGGLLGMVGVLRRKLL